MGAASAGLLLPGPARMSTFAVGGQLPELTVGEIQPMEVALVGDHQLIAIGRPGHLRGLQADLITGREQLELVAAVAVHDVEVIKAQLRVIGILRPTIGNSTLLTF